VPEIDGTAAFAGTGRLHDRTAWISQNIGVRRLCLQHPVSPEWRHRVSGKESVPFQRISAPGRSRAKNTGSFGKLYVQVLIGVAIGILLGYAEPQLAISLKPVGDAFIKAIKLMVAPIVFTTVVVGIATMGNIRRVASVGLRTIIYFEIASTLALIVGIVVQKYLARRCRYQHRSEGGWGTWRSWLRSGLPRQIHGSITNQKPRV
jgi:hypothetical protein